MKNLTIAEIVKETNGELIQGNEEYECINFSKDTRTIQKDDCYIGIKGGNFDGSKFWKQALDKGASTVIVENVEITEEDKKQYKEKNIIKVKNTLEALYKIANYKRNRYNIPVIGITGSVGKTSTKDMVANVVAQKYKTLKTIGNNNNNIGLPFTILRLKDEEAMVLEMGMDHLREIALLSKIARPDICVITNIGTSHIKTLGTQENILKAKLEILEGTENPTIIINKDDKLLNEWYEKNKKDRKIITYGIKNESNIMAKDIELTLENSKYTCVVNDEEIEMHVPVGGEHYVLNSLCATAIGKVLGIENEKIAEGIKSFELTKRRMEITELEPGIKIINDAYNANCESMQASLKILSSNKQNRKISVLGDMLNLGEFSKELHEKVGKAVVENKIDILICQGEEAKNIAKEAERQGMAKEKIYELNNNEQVIEVLNKIVEKGDIILIKASNAMKFYEIAEKFIAIQKK